MQNTNNKKISFLVTFYNQKDYIRRALDSILAQQGNFDWEILIGDDGSSDGSIDIYNEYIQRYPDKIRLYVMSREIGVKYLPVFRVCQNRLNILSYASGDYFTIMDGDDNYCNYHFVENAINALEKHKIASCCAFNFQIERDEKIENINQRSSTGFINNEEYIKNKYTHSGAIVFRNNLTNHDIHQFKNKTVFDDNGITLIMTTKHNIQTHKEKNDNIKNNIREKWGGGYRIRAMYYIDNIVYSYHQNIHSIWNSSSQLEKQCINIGLLSGLLDLNIIKTKLIIYRFRKTIRHLYKNRYNIKQLLGDEKFDMYDKIYREYKHPYVHTILHWKESSLQDKTKATLFYLYSRVVKFTL